MGLVFKYIELGVRCTWASNLCGLKVIATKNKNSKGVNRRAIQKKSPEQYVNIPKFISDPVLTWTTRLFVPASASDVVTAQHELPIVPWGVSNSAVNVYVPFKSVRLRGIRMWCNYRPDISLGMGANTINFSIIERPSVRPIEWSDTATYQKAAFISKKFNKREPLGYYYQSTSGVSNPEIKFQLPKGGLLELDFAYILSDSDAVLNATVVGATTGRVYTNSVNVSFEPVGRSYWYVLTV